MQREMANLQDYINELPSESQLYESRVGYYPFDKIRKALKKDKTGHHFVADDNENVGSRLAPVVIPGIKNNALRFEQDYDRLFISKEIPNFEWVDSFSGGVWINTDQQNSQFRQFIMGTTGGKNNLWRGWDFYLDGENKLNFRLINVAPGNMIHVKAPEIIPTEKWKHLAFSYDGSGKAKGVKIYIDGEKNPLRKFNRQSI